MKPQMSPPHALVPFWKCSFKTKHRNLRGTGGRSHRGGSGSLDKTVQLTLLASRPRGRMNTDSTSEDSVPPISPTRGFPPVQGPLPHRRRVVISPTPDVEILERPSSLERQPPSKVPPEPTFPSPIRTPAPTEESELIIIDETLEEAPPSPSLPDVPASTGPDEDAISIAGSASSIGTQAGSSTQSESGTQKNKE